MQVKILGYLFLLMGQVSFAFAQEQTYQVDMENSEVSFEVIHLGYLKVTGTFHRFSGDFLMQKGKLETIEGKIEVGSVDTQNNTRDKSLRGEGYLDAQAFPFIQFSSTRIDPLNKIITGNLTISGVTQRVQLPFKQTDYPQGKLITLSTTLNRKDFELDFGALDSLVGDEVKVKMIIRGVEKAGKS